jgi:hypothetical protein
MINYAVFDSNSVLRKWPPWRWAGHLLAPPCKISVLPIFPPANTHAHKRDRNQAVAGSFDWPFIILCDLWWPLLPDPNTVQTPAKGTISLSKLGCCCYNQQTIPGSTFWLINNSHPAASVLILKAVWGGYGLISYARRKWLPQMNVSACLALIIGWSQHSHLYNWTLYSTLLFGTGQPSPKCQ